MNQHHPATDTKVMLTVTVTRNTERREGASMSSKLLVGAGTILFALALAACASSPPPIAELSRAHTLVEQAEQGGAQQFAAADLDSARHKLQLADQKDTKPEAALRLAREASIDAQVAVARARVGKAEQAVAEVNASVESLRRETHHDKQQ
jgi:hypothetical protein